MDRIIGSPLHDVLLHRTSQPGAQLTPKQWQFWAEANPYVWLQNHIHKDIDTSDDRELVPFVPCPCTFWSPRRCCILRYQPLLLFSSACFLQNLLSAGYRLTT